METRARYALIGLFMLAVILASFAFVYWLENKGGFTQRETYQVHFDGTVSGLLIGSAVLFNGIRVGEVTQLALNPDAPQQVVATIAVDRNTPIRSDTQVGIETQGLTGGAAVTLRGGSGSTPAVLGEGGSPPTLIAQPGASQDWTQAAREAFQRVDDVLAQNAQALNQAITNIETFTDALARNSDKVDGILAGLERMTGGGTGAGGVPVFDLTAATDLPPPPAETPSWQLIIPEPTTVMGFNTDRILLQPAEGESKQLQDARLSDNLPVLFQAKLIQSFENAGYAQAVTRTQEGLGGYRLLIDIRRFHLSTAANPEAEIEFMAKIVDGDGKIVAAKLFEITAPAKGTDTQAYVSALDEAFGKVQTELLQWSAATLDAAPPLPTPPAAEALPDEPPAEPPADDQPSDEQPPADSSDQPMP
ncbi:MAG: ABC-type transport auxiliary lipoprotein family protein [Methyloceanibacter sp.]|nr:ABC-type transport auxiliary lipoprotein family protein [Methyloceanibacter sp.]